MFIFLFIFLLNRYRAFRRASDMRSNLYVTCCKMCILGRVEAISGLSWGDFSIFGCTLEQYWALSGPSWGHFGRSWGVLGSSLGLRVRGLGFDHHNAYLLEMQKSLSPYACAAKTLGRETNMSSSIEIAYLVEMHKSLSPNACAAKSLSM